MSLKNPFFFDGFPKHHLHGSARAYCTPGLVVQRLRSKRWTYKSKLCLSLCLSVFHSVSNFVGFLLVKALPIGTSAPTVQSYVVHSLLHRVGVKSLAEQCHTQIFLT